MEEDKNPEGQSKTHERNYEDKLISLFIAEYNILRKEIDLYHTQQDSIVNFVILIFTAMFGVLGASIAISTTTASKTAESLAFIFLLFPFIYTLLSFFYLDRTLRIIRIADYIHNNLRKKVCETCGEYVWQWEIYKNHTELFNRNLALILDKSRFLVFIFPSIASIYLFCSLASYPYKLGYWILMIFDGIAIILALYVIRFMQETKGITHTWDIDLDRYENTAFRKKR